MIKKALIGLVGLVVVLAVGLFLLGSNMDALIKSGVEKYGTLATKAQTTLDKVELKLGEGKASLQGFKLGNPEGFKTESAMKLGVVAVDIDPNSVMSDGPIVIRNILIDAPELTYEVIKSGASNLETIQNNIKAFAASLSKGKTAAAPEAGKQEAAAEASGERKIIVEHLTVSNGRVKLSHEMLAGKDLVDAKLPTIEMNNIGKESQGVTAAALTQILMQKVTAKAMEVGQSSLVNNLREQGIGALKGAVEESEVGKAIGNIFGK